MAEPEGQGGVVVVDPRGVLRQGRAFLDLFWDIAKPEQEVRLAATENLLRHLREGRKVRRGPRPRRAGRRGRGCGQAAGGRGPSLRLEPRVLGRGRPAGPRGSGREVTAGAGSVLQDDELKYTLKRLVEGLGATREAARPGFSLALAQVSASPPRPLANRSQVLGSRFAGCEVAGGLPPRSSACGWQGKLLQQAHTGILCSFK